LDKELIIYALKIYGAWVRGSECKGEEIRIWKQRWLRVKNVFKQVIHL